MENTLYNKTNSTPSTKGGWTIIELIFVIIIISILGAIAIPKLAATRDDAKLATDVSNMAQCITEVGAKYTATGIDVVEGDSKACNKVKCFNITYANNGSNFIVTTNPGPPSYCSRINLLGSHLAHTYTFKGSKVSF